MNKAKEYKAKAEGHKEVFEMTAEAMLSDYWTGAVSYYLDSEQGKELRKEVKERIKAGAYKLPECNGKATVKRLENGDLVLTSYYTDVASFENGEFKKLWGGFSVTTLKHVNEFRKFVGLKTIGKHEWIMLETA